MQSVCNTSGSIQCVCSSSVVLLRSQLEKEQIVIRIMITCASSSFNFFFFTKSCRIFTEHGLVKNFSGELVLCQLYFSNLDKKALSVCLVILLWGVNLFMETICPQSIRTKCSLQIWYFFTRDYLYFKIQSYFLCNTHDLHLEKYCLQGKS